MIFEEFNQSGSKYKVRNKLICKLIINDIIGDFLFLEFYSKRNVRQTFSAIKGIINW